MFLLNWKNRHRKTACQIPFFCFLWIFLISLSKIKSKKLKIFQKKCWLFFRKLLLSILSSGQPLRQLRNAGVAELADAQASGACGRKIVWVQVPSPALFFSFVTNTRDIWDPVAFFCCTIFLCTTEFFFACILLKKAFCYDTILKI